MYLLNLNIICRKDLKVLAMFNLIISQPATLSAARVMQRFLKLFLKSYSWNAEILLKSSLIWPRRAKGFSTLEQLKGPTTSLDDLGNHNAA